MRAVFKKLRTKLLENGEMSGIINLLLYGLTYNTCGHARFPSPPPPPFLWGSEKYNGTRKISTRIIC